MKRFTIPIHTWYINTLCHNVCNGIYTILSVIFGKDYILVHTRWNTYEQLLYTKYNIYYRELYYDVHCSSDLRSRKPQMSLQKQWLWTPVGFHLSAFAGNQMTSPSKNVWQFLTHLRCDSCNRFSECMILNEIQFFHLLNSNPQTRVCMCVVLWLDIITRDAVLQNKAKAMT